MLDINIATVHSVTVYSNLIYTDLKNIFKNMQKRYKGICPLC